MAHTGADYISTCLWNDGFSSLEPDPLFLLYMGLGNNRPYFCPGLSKVGTLDHRLLVGRHVVSICLCGLASVQI